MDVFAILVLGRGFGGWGGELGGEGCFVGLGWVWGVGERDFAVGVFGDVGVVAGAGNLVLVMLLLIGLI